MSLEMWVVLISVFLLALSFCSMPSAFQKEEETKIVEEEEAIFSEFVKDLAREEKKLLMVDSENNHGKQDG